MTGAGGWQEIGDSCTCHRNSDIHLLLFRGWFEVVDINGRRFDLRYFYCAIAGMLLASGAHAKVGSRLLLPGDFRNSLEAVLGESGRSDVAEGEKITFRISCLAVSGRLTDCVTAPMPNRQNSVRSLESALATRARLKPGVNGPVTIKIVISCGGDEVCWSGLNVKND